MVLIIPFIPCLMCFPTLTTHLLGVNHLNYTYIVDIIVDMIICVLFI